MEPLGTSLRAALDLDVSGENIAVAGCGLIGLFAVAAVRAIGAAKIDSVKF